MKLFTSGWLLLLLLAFNSSTLYADVRGQLSTATPNGSNGVTINGWACDSGVNQSIAVHLYLGAPASQGPIFTNITADQPSEPAVATACSNSYDQHRFSVSLTNQQWLEHAGEAVYAYGISTSGGSNNALIKSGTVIIPDYVAPANYVKGNIDSVAEYGDGVRLTGWACDWSIKQSINVHFYLGAPASPGNAFANIVADKSSEAGVSGACGTTNTSHRFILDMTTSQWQTHSGQTVYAYGISTTGGANNSLTNSGSLTIPDYVWGLSDYTINPGDDFTVAAGSVVVIDQSVDIGTLTIAGDLVCADTSASYNLDAQQIMVMDGGRFICGSETERFDGQLNVRMKAGLERAIMVAAGGEVHWYGQDHNIGWQRINGTVLAGATAVTLSSPVNWAIGDTLVLSSTGFDMNEAERLTITAISADKLTVSFAQTLQYHHYGVVQSFTAPAKTWALDERAFVANLSRNIKVSSYLGDHQASQLGAHMMVMTGGFAFVDAVEFIEMGRLGELGRYPFHWHHGGDVNGQTFKNSVVRDSYQRCVVIHASNYATVSNNVCYNHNGHGIFLEDGSERKNVIENNLVLGSKKLAAEDALLISEVVGVPSRFPAPSSYWISNPDNSVSGNVAAGSDGTGFWMSFEDTQKCNGGSVGCSVPVQTDTLVFDANIALASKVGMTWDGAPTGAAINPDGTNLALENAHYSPTVKAQFNDLVYFKNREAGVYFRGNAASFNNNIAADNRWGLFFAYSQHYKNGAVIGKSANYTNDDLAEMVAQSNQRLGGVILYDGPFELENVDFLNFPGRPQTYNNADITPTPFINIGGFNRFENKVTGLTFTPEPLKRMYWSDSSVWMDASYSVSLRDLDGSLTGTAGKLVVHNVEFNDHPSCVAQTSWNAQVCDYQPVLYILRDVSNEAAFFDLINPDGVMVTAPVTQNKRHNKFNAIPGSDGFYTMVPNSDWLVDNAFKITIQGEGMDVLGPVVKIQGKSCSLANTVELTSLNALLSSTDAGYYRQGSDTYFRLKTLALFATHVQSALSDVHSRTAIFSCD